MSSALLLTTSSALCRTCLKLRLHDLPQRGGRKWIKRQYSSFFPVVKESVPSIQWQPGLGDSTVKQYLLNFSGIGAKRQYSAWPGEDVSIHRQERRKSRRSRFRLSYNQKRMAMKEVVKGLERYQQRLLDEANGLKFSQSPEILQDESMKSTGTQVVDNSLTIGDGTMRDKRASDKALAARIKKRGFKLVSQINADGQRYEKKGSPSSIVLFEENPRLLYSRTYSFQVPKDGLFVISGSSENSSSTSAEFEHEIDSSAVSKKMFTENSTSATEKPKTVSESGSEIENNVHNITLPCDKEESIQTLNYVTARREGDSLSGQSHLNEAREDKINVERSEYLQPLQDTHEREPDESKNVVCHGEHAPVVVEVGSKEGPVNANLELVNPDEVQDPSIVTSKKKSKKKKAKKSGNVSLESNDTSLPERSAESELSASRGVGLVSSERGSDPTVSRTLDRESEVVSQKKSKNKKSTKSKDVIEKSNISSAEEARRSNSTAGVIEPLSTNEGVNENLVAGSLQVYDANEVRFSGSLSELEDTPVTKSKTKVSLDTLDTEASSNDLEKSRFGWIEEDEEEIPQLRDIQKDKKKKKKKSQEVAESVENLKEFHGKELKKDPVHLDEVIMTDRQIEALRKRFNQDLLSYIQAYISVKEVERAQSHIRLFYTINNRTGNRALVEQITDVNIFNELLHAWAKEANISKMGEVWSFMWKSGVQPTMQSYAASLECLGRKTVPLPSAIKALISEMKAKNFTLNDILRDSILMESERKFVLKAIKLIEPHFKPAKSSKRGDSLTSETKSLPLVEKLYGSKVPEHDNPFAKVKDIQELQRLITEQLKREKSQLVKVRSIVAPEEPSERAMDCRQKMEDLKYEWTSALRKALHKKIRSLQNRRNTQYGMNLYPYLKLLPVEEYVDIIIKELEQNMANTEYYTPPLHVLHERLGRQVYNRCLYKHRASNETLEKMVKVFREFIRKNNVEQCRHKSHMDMWEEVCKRNYGTTSIRERKFAWSNYLIKRVGALLYELALTNLTVDSWMFHTSAKEENMVPAFYKIYRCRNSPSEVRAELKPFPTLLKLARLCEPEELTFNVEDIPMISPPLPWTSKDNGGNLIVENELVRTNALVETQLEFLSEVQDHQYHTVYDALNKIAYCPWKVNTELLDIMINIFRNHGNKDLDIAPDVASLPKLPVVRKDMKHKEKKETIRKVMQLKKLRNETYSLWCTDLYRLSIANMLRDQVLWFPHNMDFRSRIYPTCTYLNQQGSDTVRGLLLFAKGKPLGEKGLDWLKIHLINLTGLKKRVPNSERLAYANEVMEDILDSADHPLDGKRWWMDADEPWQTLAACKEIANAVRSLDPTQYVCHLPIHQDGSCNGLQHYAALGRDQQGAESVNLCPIDRPMDVYSDVVDLVEEGRKQDAEDGMMIAQVLEGFVKRKVIKQTIMTTVYGVTLYGSKLQILRQLKDIPEFPQEHVKEASKYLAAKTFQCLQKRFTATKEIQDWFTIISYMMGRDCNRPMIWTTPLGMPVLQPYFRRPKADLRLLDQIGIKNGNHTEMPYALKQKNGFPPNFIHSLDSTHMMLTALYCWRAGISFTSIHDCFWTHACDVDTMNKVCREQFVDLHSQPILENLSREQLVFLEEAKLDNENKSKEHITKLAMIGNIIRSVPRRGELDLNDVLQSTYFFS